MFLWKLRNFGILGILESQGEERWKFRNFFRRSDCHPFVNRSCLIKGHGLSTWGGGDHMCTHTLSCLYVYIYVHIYIYIYTRVCATFIFLQT